VKLRYKISVALVIVLLLPFLFIPLILFFEGLMLGSSFANPLDSLREMPVFDYLRLHFAVSGVLMVVGLPYLFYTVTKRGNEKGKQEEFNRRKLMLRDVLYNGLDQVLTYHRDGHWESFDYVRVTNNHVELVHKLGDLFSKQQAQFLIQVLESLKDISEQEEKGETKIVKMSVEKLVTQITIPNYPKHLSHLQHGSSNSDLLSEEIIAILDQLSEETDPKSFQVETINRDNSTKL